MERGPGDCVQTQDMGFSTHKQLLFVGHILGRTTLMIVLQTECFREGGTFCPETEPVHHTTNLAGARVQWAVRPKGYPERHCQWQRRSGYRVTPMSRSATGSASVVCHWQRHNSTTVTASGTTVLIHAQCNYSYPCHFSRQRLPLLIFRTSSQTILSCSGASLTLCGASL